MTMQEIVALSAALLTVLATWWKLFSTTKAFQAVKDQLKEKTEELKGTIAACDGCIRASEKEIVRLDEAGKNREKEISQIKADSGKSIEQVRADLVRDAQIMSNQLNVVHQKIDHIDEKVDDLLRRGNK